MNDYKCHIKNLIRDLVEANKLSTTEYFFSGGSGWFRIFDPNPFDLSSTCTTKIVIIQFATQTEGSYYYKVTVDLNEFVKAVDEVFLIT